MNRSILLLLTVALFPFIFVGNAFACSCSNKPTILEQMEYSQVVVAGQIDSVQKIREEEREYDYGAYRSATLVVDKVYSGNVKVGDRLVLAQGGGADCAFTWNDKAVGTKWLFYLGKPSTDHYRYLEESDQIDESQKVPMYGTSFCGRSTGLISAAQDLAYLENLTKHKGKTRVSGELSFGEHSVEGIKVRITGKNSQFATKYVKGGFFEIYDIPPGEYLLELFPPSGWRIVNHWRTTSRYEKEEFSQDVLEKLKKNQRLIRVTKGSHLNIDLGLAPDTLIKGRVLSPTGRPMPKVCVSVVPMKENETERGWDSCTDAKGEFQFETISPGNYFLVANPHGKLDDEQPFGKLYYPGVASRKDAGIIAVEPGKYDLGLIINVPEMAPLIEIVGRILFADDKPAKGIWVRFEPSDQGKFDKVSARSDEDGRFLLKIPLGAAGLIRGSDYFSEYSYSNCPKIMEAVKANDSSEITTTSLEITGNEPNATTTLRLPFDFCKEK